MGVFVFICGCLGFYLWVSRFLSRLLVGGCLGFFLVGVLAFIVKKIARKWAPTEKKDRPREGSYSIMEGYMVKICI